MLGHVLNSKLGNFHIRALCVILDSPLLTSIPPHFVQYDNISGYSDGSQFYFLSKFQYSINKTDMLQFTRFKFSSGDRTTSFPLALFILFIALVFTCCADLIHFSAQRSCDMKRWHFPVLGKES